MLRRLEQVVQGIRDHVAVARQLSAGALEAFTVLTRGPHALELTFARHDARIRHELPGF